MDQEFYILFKNMLSHVIIITIIIQNFYGVFLYADGEEEKCDLYFYLVYDLLTFQAIIKNFCMFGVVDYEKMIYRISK